MRPLLIGTLLLCTTGCATVAPGQRAQPVDPLAPVIESHLRCDPEQQPAPGTVTYEFKERPGSPTERALIASYSTVGLPVSLHVFAPEDPDSKPARAHLLVVNFADSSWGTATVLVTGPDRELSSMVADALDTAVPLGPAGLVRARALSVRLWAVGCERRLSLGPVNSQMVGVLDATRQSDV